MQSKEATTSSDDPIHTINIGSDEPANALISNNVSSRGSSRRSGKVSPDPAGEKKKGKTKSYKTTILVLLQVLVLLLILGFLLASLLVQVLKTKFAGGLEIWKWCLFALSILCGFTLVLRAYWPVISFIEYMFKLQPEVLYFVYGLRKSGAFFIWWIWVLVMWFVLMDHQIKEASPKADNILDTATQTIISLAVASFGWILVTIALRLLSVKCRFRRYEKRVIQAGIDFEILRGLSRNLSAKKKRRDWLRMNKPGKAFAKNDFTRLGTFSSDKLSFLNWDYFFDHEYIDLDLTTLRGTTNISTEGEAREVARKIFDNVVATEPNLEYRSKITQAQLDRFLDKKQFESWPELFKAEEIDKKKFTEWVVKVYQSRKPLIQALKNNKSATKQLSILMRTALAIVSIIVWLLWIDVLTKNLLVAFLTGLGGGIFIFGEAVKMTFQSIIFVFVVHPFDIGDECIIENNTMLVDEMNILTTIFLDGNNEKTYYSNYLLSSKVISNSTRSSLVSDTVLFFIDMETPAVKIANLMNSEMIRKMEGSSIVVEGNENEHMKMRLRFTYKKPEDKNGVIEEFINSRPEIIGKLAKFLTDENIVFSFSLTEDADVYNGIKNQTQAGSSN